MMTARAARIAIRIAAMRLDTGVTPKQFCDEIENLIDAVLEAAKEIAAPAAPEDDPLDPTDDVPDVHDDSEDIDSDDTEDDAPPSPQPAAQPPPRPDRPRPVPYDDRVRMRVEYDASKERNGGRAPRGTLEALASRFKCTKNQAHDICYRKGD